MSKLTKFESLQLAAMLIQNKAEAIDVKNLFDLAEAITEEDIERSKKKPRASSIPIHGNAPMPG